MTRIEKAQDAYFAAFGVAPPEPFAINDEAIADELEKAVEAGAPVPDDFDWWAHVPADGAA
jgi:hypothetical protein